MAGILRRTVLGAAFSATGIILASHPALAVTAGWRIAYHLPGQNGLTDTVSAIAATSTGNAWAVGGKLAIVHGNAEGVPAVFHWNGKSWTQVFLPGPVHEGGFSAVSASSATDVWAIGGCMGCAGFAAHWNGKKWTWHASIATSPASIAAFSQSNVWVADYTHLDHWTGRSWHRYAAAPGWNGVWALSGIAADDIWAAGLAVGGLQPEAVHWNGVSWKLARVPDISLPASGEAIPAGVTAESARNAWIAGAIQYPDPVSSGLTDYQPFVLHWNGKAWRQLGVPAWFPPDFGFTHLASDGRGGFWAVAGTPRAPATEKLLHYRGGRWQVTSLPPIPGSAAWPSGPTLSDIARVPGTWQMWAPVVYQQATSGEFREAILRYTP